jgi:hypothetical protein
VSGIQEELCITPHEETLDKPRAVAAPRPEDVARAIADTSDSWFLDFVVVLRHIDARVVAAALFKPLPPHDPDFGVDPEDSARLLELRDAIDTHLGWKNRADEEAGDYVARVKEFGELHTDPGCAANQDPERIQRRTPREPPGEAMSYIVTVTGERDWRDRETIYRVLDEELAWCCGSREEPTYNPARFILRHGVAEGADWIANDWGKERGVTIERFPAEWKDPVTRIYNPSAGPIRNRKMAKAEPRADKVVAFWSGKLRVKFGKKEYSGTLDMIQAGLDAGIPVRITPPSKVEA